MLAPIQGALQPSPLRQAPYSRNGFRHTLQRIGPPRQAPELRAIAEDSASNALFLRGCFGPPRQRVNIRPPGVVRCRHPLARESQKFQAMQRRIQGALFDALDLVVLSTDVCYLRCRKKKHRASLRGSEFQDQHVEGVDAKQIAGFGLFWSLQESHP